MSEKDTAPISIFIYNRKDKVNRLLNSLFNCNEFSKSKVYVFCDGPKNETENVYVQETRDEAKRLLINKRQITFIEHQKNIGLAKSIYYGVSHVLKKHNTIIVLEDDLIVNRGFLKYMNNALKKYEDNSDIYQVSGYFINPIDLNLCEAICLPNISTWGWGTWKKSWEGFGLEKNFTLKKWSKKRKLKFNLNNSYNYFYILKGTLKGKIDSWGILWYLYVFNRNGLVLYPNKSLVKNIGFDRSATNTKRKPNHSMDFSTKKIEIILPEDLKINQRYSEKIYDYIKKVYKEPFYVKVLKYFFIYK